MSKSDIHIIPTLDQLLDFKKGRLSEKDNLWVAECLEQNAMLKGVYDHIENIPFDDVENLTKKTNQKIPPFYEPVNQSNRFWNIKTIAAIVIIFLVFLGAIILAANFNNDELEFSTLSLKDNDFNVDENFKNTDVYKENRDFEQEINMVDSDSSSDKVVIQEIEKTEIKKKIQNSLIISSSEKKQTKVQADKTVDEKDINIEVKLQNESIIGKAKPVTITKVNEKNEEESVRNTVEVNEINISKKLSVAADNDKSKKTNSPFLQSAPLKDSNSKSNTEKIPSFKGGDQGLLDYIKSGLGLTQIALDDEYSDKLFLNFIINKQGEIEDWQMYGHVAPEISKKIRKIMDEMPEWNKGKAFGKKGQASYSIIISF